MQVVCICKIMARVCTGKPSTIKMCRNKTHGMFKNQMVWPGARRFLEERKKLARN